MKLERTNLTIPVPPTDNRYYGKPKGGRHKYLTKAGKEYRDQVAAAVVDAGLRGAFGSDNIAIRVELHLAHGGDIWNRLKGLGDALQHARLIEDDKQICDSRIMRGHRVKGGRCRITIWRM